MSEPHRPTDPDSWGIHRHYIDAHDLPQQVSEQTIAALRRVIGEPPTDLETRAPIVSRPGRDLGLGPVEVLCEDGRALYVDGVLPADFPLGYHRVRTSEGHDRRLIVSPGRCWLPGGWRAWGWAVQLYATRSHASWGIGDLADLRTVREWAASQGAGFLLVNPLHAVAPTHPQEDSPYLPATRRFRNPIYLRVEDVPGAEGVDLSDLAGAGRELSAHPSIDRDAVWRLKSTALERIFASGGDRSDFERWQTAQGQPLQNFATWAALAQCHGPDWRDWDTALHDPDGAAVATFVAEHAHLVAFHAWLQWLFDLQMRSAGAALTVIQDLPIGVDGGGADAWAWQGSLATGVTVGAPPDIFNPAGQDWGSPPPIPWQLRAADYEPFIQGIRNTMASGGGTRIDHVMGLFRLWWVPPGAAPADGAYVRYPSEDLLDIVALESHRARALVVGEDLGTVEAGVREALEEHAILSYRLLWFEVSDPDEWPVASMAAVTTHDLPTVTGLWSGSDLIEQAQHMDATGLDEGREELLARLRGPAGLAADTHPERVVVAAHRLLARAPSVLLSATLDDVVGAERRPNMPATSSRDNWQIPLPVWVEDLPGHPVAAAVSDVLRAAVGQSS